MNRSVRSFEGDERRNQVGEEQERRERERVGRGERERKRERERVERIVKEEG